MVLRWLAVLTTVMVACPVGAEPAAEEEPAPASEIEWSNAVFEATFALAVPTFYYWGTQEHQQVDFTLRHDWDGWKDKLTSTRYIKWDTNQFHINAIRHPIAGTIDYQIARTNGFGPISSTVFATLKGAFWEYFIEYRESPSLNDLLINMSAGLAIGEPTYQLAQQWRGGSVSWGDRARAAMFSPFDALHDLDRGDPSRRRPRAPMWVVLSTGGLVRQVDGVQRGEVAAAADLDLVAEPAFRTRRGSDVVTHAGAWSRFRAGARIGDVGAGAQLVGTEVHTSTSLFGHFHQDPAGTAMHLGVGTGFTYRNDVLATDKDRIGIAHLVGLQWALAIRRPKVDLRLDAAVYADFGMIQALVFNAGNPFPRPPPFYSALQADGYIDAFGVTGTLRARARIGPVHVELEGTSHGLWQTVGHDRDGDGDPESAVVRVDDDTVVGEVTTYGIGELRMLGRAQLGYSATTWGVALVLDGARRQSSWVAGDQVRTSTEVGAGALITLTY